jgi:hypothetical protein
MDQIDAVAAAAAEPTAEEHRQVTVKIATTGRHVVISFPVDMTDSEALEFIGWLGSDLRQALAQERATRVGRGLIVPARLLRQ